ncbi:MAG: nucleotidyltransferase domain-containing protein [Actinomycetales bacterium]
MAFGSAARGDGNTRSDIDLLLVHPAFAQEEGSTGSSERIQPHGLEELEGFPSGRDEGLVHRWQEQLDDLRDKVLEWTGNRLQVVDLSDVEFLRACQERQALMRHVERDGIQLMAPAVGLTWQSGEISWLDPSAPALPRRQMPFDGSG